MSLAVPPPTFRDRFPERGPFTSVQTPPAPYTTAELLFADGRTYHGTWCPGGTVHPPLWWGWCTLRKKFCAVQPIGWRMMRRAHST